MQEGRLQYIIATLDKELYGFDVRYIESIIEMHKITRVPGSQKHYLGVVNLRGEIIPVMSLRRKLGLADDEFTDVSRIIIVRPEAGDETVGIAVDEVNEVITLGIDDLDTLDYDKKDVSSNYNIAIGKSGDNLINLLNITKLIIEEEDSN